MATFSRASRNNLSTSSLVKFLGLFCLVLALGPRSFTSEAGFFASEARSFLSDSCAVVGPGKEIVGLGEDVCDFWGRVVEDIVDA
ncbi:hypothetical protein F4819DRAFT_55459 [Hypoxylon fuscum]|nr:hypothetical protein F4819DRAFT_55459 [Hypoxylon fuscum]